MYQETRILYWQNWCILLLSLLRTLAQFTYKVIKVLCLSVFNNENRVVLSSLVHTLRLFYFSWKWWNEIIKMTKYLNRPFFTVFYDIGSSPCRYCIYSKYWDTLTPDQSCQKIGRSLFHYLVKSLKYCWMSGKQCRQWSNVTFCSIWSRCTIFAQACLSQYLGYMYYGKHNVLRSYKLAPC